MGRDTQKEKAIIDLVINGEQSKTTLKDITTAAVNARKELNRMVEADNPNAYKEKLKAVQALTAAQQQHAARIRDTASAWGKFTKGAGSIMTGVVGGNIATAGLEAIMNLIPQVIDKSIQLKDELADIAKAADLTDSEVEGLNNQLKSMDTRTPTKELRQIAEVGGQFGVAKDQLGLFTDGMNQLNVAIGKDFGGVDNLAKDMTAVRNIFTNIKTDRIDQDLLHIGNAFNVLEAAGAATSPVMADFASRMGGTLIPLGLSEAQVLGYSATLQELNVTAERGSTAVVDIFQKMLTETETFAKVASMPLKEYKDLIGKDINAAFQKYLEGLRKVQPNQVEFAHVLEKSKLTGSGVMEVLSKLSVNSEMLATKTDMAGDALKRTDSITAEYSKKNFELAVNMKKISEWFDGFMTSPAVMGFASWLSGAGVKMLGLGNAAKEANTQFQKQKTLVKDLTDNIEPLLKRHDELKRKSVLTTAEQAEMRKVIDQVAKALPQAATQFDAYGNALDINTDKARKAIETQRSLSRYLNQEAIDENQKARRKLLEEQVRLQRELNGGTVTESKIYGREIRTTVRKMTDAEITERQQRLQELRNELDENKNVLSGLGQDSVEDRRAKRNGKPALPAPGEGAATGKPDAAKPGASTETIAGLGDDKKKSKAEILAEKSAKRAADLEQMMSEARQRGLKNAKENYEADLLAFGDRYEKMIALAGTSKQKLEEISDVMYTELESMTARHDEKEREKQAESLKELQEAAIGELEVRKKLAEAAIDLEIAAGRMDEKEGGAAKSSLEESLLNAKYLLQTGYYDSLAELGFKSLDKQKEIEGERKKTLDSSNADIQQAVANHAQACTDVETARTEADLELAKKRVKAAEIELARKKELFNDSLAVIKFFFKENTLIYRAAMIANQAWAIAEVAIDYSKALMKSIASAAGIPFPGNLIAIAKSVAIPTLQSAASIARIRAQKFDMPSFADGGFTNGPTVYGNNNRRFLAGEAGTEFIMSNPMLRNPVMADLARIMNVLQTTGTYKQLSYGNSGASDNRSPVEVDQLLVVAKLEELRKETARMANRPQSFDFLAWERKTNRVAQIRQVTTL